MEDGLFLMFESLKEVLSILTLYNVYIINSLISQVPIAAYIHTPTGLLTCGNAITPDNIHTPRLTPLISICQAEPSVILDFHPSSLSDRWDVKTGEFSLERYNTRDLT